jgi:hypothetical protein
VPPEGGGLRRGDDDGHRTRVGAGALPERGNGGAREPRRAPLGCPTSRAHAGRASARGAAPVAARIAENVGSPVAIGTESLRNRAATVPGTKAPRLPQGPRTYLVEESDGGMSACTRDGGARCRVRARPVGTSRAFGAAVVRVVRLAGGGVADLARHGPERRRAPRGAAAPEEWGLVVLSPEEFAQLVAAAKEPPGATATRTRPPRSRAGQ